MTKVKPSYIFPHILWFGVIAYLSYRMPFYSDDFIHAMSFATGEDITRVDQILPSVFTYYQIWGGRAISMFFIQLMLFLPRWVYAVLNGIIFVLMINIEYKYVAEFNKTADTKWYFIVISGLYCMTWFFMPDFEGVVTWTTGTVTYLWMNTVIIAFGFLYYRDYLGNRVADSAFPDGEQGQGGKTAVGNAGITGIIQRLLTIGGYILLGFAAGLSTEAGACTLMAALFLYVIVHIRTRKRIPAELLCGIISAVAGFFILMLAPGNFVRSAESGSVAEGGASIFMILVHRLGRETFYTLLFLTVPVAIAVLFYILSRVHQSGEGSIVADFKAGAFPLFASLAFISLAVFTFTSGFANRVFQFPLMMITIGFGLSLLKFLMETDRAEVSRKILRAFSIFVCIVTVFVAVEVVAGVLLTSQTGSFFDRQMLYYHYDDKSVDGLLPGNGIIK